MDTSVSGYKYAWQEIRLLIAQQFIWLAVKFTPADTPEFLLFRDLIKKWKDEAEKVVWRPRHGK